MVARIHEEDARRDLFAAHALSGLMAGELGRMFLTMDYQHMGAAAEAREERAYTRALRVARMAASAAVLAADAMLELLAFNPPDEE